MFHWLAADRTTNVGNDNREDFSYYTALGWEASVGRLKLIRMINSGRIKRDDTLVTTKDRMFMYPFCRTQSYTPSFVPAY